MAKAAPRSVARSPLRRRGGAGQAEDGVIPGSIRRGRALFGLLFTTLLLPLGFLGLGLWEQQRGAEDEALMQGRRDQLAAAVTALQERPPGPAGRMDFGARFRLGGQTYVGPLALAKAQEALADAEGDLQLAGLRRHLPPVVILGAGTVAALSALVLLAALLLGQAGRRSRDALVGGFSVMRRGLPLALGLQVVAAAATVIAATAFEASALLGSQLSGGSAKLLAVALLAIGASLWTAVQAVLQLRRTLALFTPDALPILGRPVSRAEAPGLWRLLDEQVQRLGALPPDHVVVGLGGGFFVASGPKHLDPGAVALTGRTLYLPLPWLALLREDEVAAIIGHELAHFAGGDTEYSLRFLPIYAGVERSLEAVVTAGQGPDGAIAFLMRPALRLGLFVMDRFHRAVRHWSRRREFAADAAGAGVSSAEAAGRALLRTAAAEGRIAETLGAAFRAPEAAPPDLVAATLEQARLHGLEDPAGQLEQRQPHPTDTHPPTRQRLEALGQAPDAAALAAAAAAAPPPPEAEARLDRWFAAPDALCRAATQDFLQVARDSARARQAALQEAAAGVAPGAVALHENTRAGAIFLFVFGGLLLAGGATLLLIEVPGTSAREAMLIGGAGGLLGLVLAGFGLPLLHRGKRPFLVLTPDSLQITGLDRPIAWADIADLDMMVENNRVTTRLLLPPEAPFPARLRGARRVKADARRRIISFTAAPPRPLKVQGFAALIARYREAEQARRILAESASATATPVAPM